MFRKTILECTLFKESLLIKMSQTSKEFRCLSKLLTTCNNRGLTDMSKQVLEGIAPKFLSKGELDSLKGTLTKSIRFENKVSFISKTKFEAKCNKCSNLVEKESPSFVNGKYIYHVLCGLNSLGESAKSNLYYNKWALLVKNEKEVSKN